MKQLKSFIKDKETNILVLIIFLIGISFFFLLLLKDDPFSLSPTGKAITQVNVSRAPPENCNFTLVQGNNLISFHCLSSITSRDYFLTPIQDNYTAIFGYNPNSLDSWASYNPELPSWVIQDLFHIDNRKGYWIIMKTDSTFFINGSISSTEIIPLKLNWNLIGYPRNVSENVNVALITIVGNYTIIMGYNESSGFWQSAGPLGIGTLENLTPDKGYWIFMNATDDLNVTW